MSLLEIADSPIKLSSWAVETDHAFAETKLPITTNIINVVSAGLTVSLHLTNSYGL